MVAQPFESVNHQAKNATWTPVLHCADCLDVMRKMPDRSVDLVVTSPPYNLLNTTGGWAKNTKGSLWASSALRTGYEGHDDNMPHDQYVAWQRECLTEMMRLIPDTGAIFYNHKWRVQGGLLQDRSDIVSGFPVRQIIIWNRKSGMNFNAGYFQPTYEVIYLIAKKRFKLAPKSNVLGDVWEFMEERDNDHPAPFPFQLPYRCISSTSAKVVLDPFMGSGTTGLAARQLERKFIGIEKSSTYYTNAVKRLSAEVTQRHLWAE